MNSLIHNHIYARGLVWNKVNATRKTCINSNTVDDSELSTVRSFPPQLNNLRARAMGRVNWRIKSPPVD